MNCALLRFKTVASANFRAPSIYTLLSLGHHDLSLGNYELTLGHRPKNGPWPIYEESLEQSPEKSPEKRQTRQSVDWRSGAQKEKLELIDSYNRICLPHRWRAVNKFTKVLDKALDYFLDSFLPGAPTERDLRETFEEAVRMRNEGDAEYNAPKGNTLIRILYRD